MGLFSVLHAGGMIYTFVAARVSRYNSSVQFSYLYWKLFRDLKKRVTVSIINATRVRSEHLRDTNNAYVSKSLKSAKVKKFVNN